MSIREVDYLPDAGRVRLRTHTGNGTPATMLLTPADAEALADRLMAAVRASKVKPAPKPPPDPKRPLARRVKYAKPRI